MVYIILKITKNESNPDDYKVTLRNYLQHSFTEEKESESYIVPRKNILSFLNSLKDENSVTRCYSSSEKERFLDCLNDILGENGVDYCEIMLG